MKFLKFLATGIIFGIILTKSELISWYRWQEMFLMDSFHVYGVMITAVLFGSIGLKLFKHFNIKDFTGAPILIPEKEKRFWPHAIGGIIFGIGWAMSGCPGATYTLIGHGQYIWIVILMSALLGTFLYGVMRKFLPH